MEFINENLLKILITTVITIIAVIILKVLEKKKKSENTIQQEKLALEENEISGNLTVGNNNYSVINNNTINHTTSHISEAQDKEEISEIERRKKLTNILFIDDDTKFNIVKILKTEGWENIKSVIDLKSYNDPKLVSSQIIFVDIQGVGKLLECKEEGLGLALHIKNQFPNKKVIIYSAIQSHKVFHEAIQKVDFLLSKDAEPIQFINLVERFSLEVI